MGLIERVMEARNKVALEEIEKTTIHQQRLAEEARNKAIVAQQEATRQKECFDELSEFLEIVAAQRQLLEVKKLWRSGVIDDRPVLLESDGNTPHLALSLRYGFNDLQQITSCSENSEWHSGSVIIQPNAVLLIAVTTKPTVQSSFCLRGDNVYDLKEPYIMSSTSDFFEGRFHWFQKPQVFFKGNPHQARQILEEQLFEILTHAPDPEEVKKTARDRIKNDPFIPKKDKYRYGRENYLDLPWYRSFF